ncbi:MAG TPA: phosphoglycerate kinase [Thermodesulfovibrio thiophilus]|uniref:phosphoglycerate kinase n=1 Tax=Thermodesulfovibrio thiophilus TaxID=340095 RepID=UPI0017DE9EC2|nr:phosphoglycerate kinase [Thermodesulfovibrio thiophilus]HHW20684.1 phosphoglycerate kinase [Thermodesulfovibrio thiophilus]HOA82758.1 phosphoglycerate kinase [Thermodesulfovibrio thiophilus]HQA03552.1 phosphoglycerate kinase [Thermodesulfovibrio thiophilus]HQD36308.1 phosphoglycerate kinase [Thermodesulfovibrio thiophilus]
MAPFNNSFDKLTIEDLPIKSKKVFIRADFNVPLDANLVITDDRRIRSTLPTINYAIDEGAKIILASHLDRPKGKVDPKLSLAPVARRLQRLLNKEVFFAPDCIGHQVESLVSKMKEGDVVLLENLRFRIEEEKNDEKFAKALASLADFYVNDAFGASHRAHASIVGIPKFIPSAAGFLLKKEIEYLKGAVESPIRPFVVILGGAKVGGKIGVLENLADKADKVIVGGGMAFTFIKAMGYEVGDSLIEADMIDFATKIMEKLRQNKVKFYLPVDVVIAQSINPGAETKIVPVQEIPQGWRGLDIGPASVKLFTEALHDAKTILWNGPMGVFEIDAFSRGTFAIAHAVADSYAFTIVGGGDTDYAVHKAGVSDSISFISTGGGASLQLLEGKELPGLAVLPSKKKD